MTRFPTTPQDPPEFRGEATQVAYRVTRFDCDVFTGKTLVVARFDQRALDAG